MQTWGIDWSATVADRAAVRLDWSRHHCVLGEVRTAAQLDDRGTIALLLRARHCWTAVDVPFGWPAEFTAFLAAHATGPHQHAPDLRDADRWRKDSVSRRETDHRVARLPGVKPLRVPYERLGATALSWAVIESEMHRRRRTIDRSGCRGPIVETYPSAVRSALGLDPSSHTVPRGVDYTGSALPNDHARDALVAAVAARARALDWSPLPTDVASRARQEGWIHLPESTVSFEQLVDGDRGPHRWSL